MPFSHVFDESLYEKKRDFGFLRRFATVVPFGRPLRLVAVGACVTVRDYFVAFYTPSYCRNYEFFNSFEKLLKIQ